MGYDSKKDTKEHISRVQKIMSFAIRELKEKSREHDKTKLQEPEKPIFDKFTPLLKDSTYGSEEYKKMLKGMTGALDHHYYHNRHHPEFFTMGPEANAGCFDSPLERMNLFDILEMVCDWKAAAERHKDGDIYKSIKINQKRFGYSDELKRVIENTVSHLDHLECDGL